MASQPFPGGRAGKREPSPLLERCIEWFRENDRDKHADWLDVLLGPTSEARTIRDWIKKRAQGARIYRLASFQDWESGLMELVELFDDHIPISARDRRPAKKMFTRKTKEVASKARALAKAMEHEAVPWSPGSIGDPSVLACFDPERIAELEELIGKQPLFDLLFDLPKQRFPSLLRRLADHVDADLACVREDRWPRLKKDDPRVFAGHLAGYFGSAYKARPHTVIAACVCIRFPDVYPQPDAYTIKDWQRHRS